jgi:hypothetical protein
MVVISLASGHLISRFAQARGQPSLETITIRPDAKTENQSGHVAN